MISKRRFGDAIVQFKKIAKINGRDFDVTEKELAEIYREDKHEVTYGIASLFAGWRLARNTIIMGFSWCGIDRRKKKAICISNCGAFLSRLQVRRCRLLLHAGVVQLAHGGKSVFELFIPEHCGDTRLHSGPPYG